MRDTLAWRMHHAQADNALVVDMAYSESPHKASALGAYLRTKELVCNAKAVHKRGSSLELRTYPGDNRTHPRFIMHYCRLMLTLRFTAWGLAVSKTVRYLQSWTRR
jgi:hypothetical protein